jgi:hypothetical protein
VEEQATLWLRRQITAAQIGPATWTTQEWLHFLKFVQDQLSKGLQGDRVDLSVRPGTAPPGARMEELDNAFRLTQTGNSEIAFQWLLMSIRNRYDPAYPRLEEFLLSVGRRKFIRPLYQELAKTPAGKQRACEIYRRARPTYHPIAVTSIDADLKCAGQ